MDTITALINKYGKPAQVLQAVEEMTELAKELLKNVNRGENNRDKILEETDHVSFLVEQIKVIYDFDEEELKQQRVLTIEKVKEYL